MQIQDTMALVTGGASGLGKATADALVAAGATVVIFDLPASEEHFEPHPQKIFVGGDVRDEDAVASAIALATENAPLRVVVNCAGIGDPTRVVRKGAAHPLAVFQRLVDVNLVGTFNVLRLAAAAMCGNDVLDEDRGVIINTASVAAFDGQIGQAAYSASKGGIAAMTLPIARDLADSAIRCVTIAPGVFDTPILKGLSDEVRASLGRSIPHPPRLGEPSEFAELVLSIVRITALNGEVIRLDGAIRMAPR